MRRILRRHEVVADDWLYLGEDGSAEATAVIVPFADLRNDTAAWLGRDGRLGVRLAPADAVEELADILPRLALVASEFPAFGEGRGYSQGRILRTRLAFTGELRAVGVKQDHLFLAARSGFDAFDLAPGEDVERALAALKRYDVAYQPGAPHVSIRRQRFSV